MEHLLAPLSTRTLAHLLETRLAWTLARLLEFLLKPPFSGGGISLDECRQTPSEFRLRGTTAGPQLLPKGITSCLSSNNGRENFAA